MSNPGRFGKYHPIAELGRGGMADVFLTAVAGPEGIGFNKLVVVKRLRPNLADDEDFVTMLVDEARLAARLNHPNIIQTVEVARVEGQYLLVMEYLDGQPFNRVRARAHEKGGIPTRISLSILVDVLAGLHYAHEIKDYDGLLLNVVHRDVSPQNIFVTYEGQVKVLDFGIAKAERRISETRQGILKGKLRYMAPEQALGSIKGKPIDRRADIFSVGVILWELLTGQRFWPKIEARELMDRLVSGEFDPSPRAVAPGVTGPLDAICRRSLAMSPTDRFSTALEFQIALEKYLASIGRASSREIGTYVSSLFTEERKTMQEVMESQLKELAARPARLRPVSLVPAPESVSNQSSVSMPMSAKARAIAAEVEYAKERTVPTLTLEEDRASRATKKVITRPSVSERSIPAPVVVSKSNMLAFAGVGALFLAVCVATGVVAFSLGGREGRRSMSAEPSLTTVASAPARASEPPTTPDPVYVRVTVSSDPKEATISVDDNPCGNPCTMLLPRDGRVHHARADAPHYVERTRTFVAKETVEIPLPLTRTPDEKP